LTARLFYFGRQEAMMQESTKGILCMILSNIMFCAMSCLVRFLSDFNVFTTTLYRFVFGIVTVLVLVIWGKATLSFNSKGKLITRGIVSGLAICLGFVGIIKLGIVKSSILFYTYPIFGSVLGILLLKEKVSVMKIAAILAAFIGMVLTTIKGNSISVSFFNIGLYELLAITGALLGGISIVLVKNLQKSETTSSIFFAQCLIGFLMVLVPSGKNTFEIPHTLIPLLLSVGFFATAGQLILTYGYKYISVGTGSVFVMLAPVFNLVAGIILFKEQISLYMAIGAVVILLSCSLIAIPKNAYEKMRLLVISGISKLQI
jgi:drug/metabolite transporter (DMT)-like permease